MDENSASKLSVPRVESVPFKRNALKLVVCEIRFPIVVEIREDSIPEGFVKALRRDYPLHDRGVSLGFGEAPEHAHVFNSMNREWAVNIRPSRISLETKHYQSFEGFHDRLQAVVKSTLPSLDTDFFTRVGLRYVNALPVPASERRDWVRASLAAVATERELGLTQRVWQEVGGNADGGSFTLRHGIARADKQDEYVLDTDFFAENVSVDDLHTLFLSIHEQSFSLFHWCLGQKALDYLGKT